MRTAALDMVMARVMPMVSQSQGTHQRIPMVVSAAKERKMVKQIAGRVSLPREPLMVWVVVVAHFLRRSVGGVLTALGLFFIVGFYPAFHVGGLFSFPEGFEIGGEVVFAFEDFAVFSEDGFAVGAEFGHVGGVYFHECFVEGDACAYGCSCIDDGLVCEAVEEFDFVDDHFFGGDEVVDFLDCFGEDFFAFFAEEGAGEFAEFFCGEAVSEAEEFFGFGGGDVDGFGGGWVSVGFVELAECSGEVAFAGV